MRGAEVAGERPGAPRVGGSSPPAFKTAFARTWRALYEGIYFVLECVTRLLFRPLFRVRRVGPLPRLPEGGVLLCPNHQSYLDPALLQLVWRRRMTFVMTNDFYSSPSARWFFRLVGAIPVARGKLARDSLRRAEALLRIGGAVVVFPEGRLSIDGSLHRGQRGVAVVARRARVPVLPVAIAGSIRAWPRGARWLRKADVRIAFGTPRSWEGPPDRESEQAFADSVMLEISELRRRMPMARP